MHDLNSVFLVCKLMNLERKAEVLTFTLVNQYCCYDEEKKEYVKEVGHYVVKVPGKQTDKWCVILKEGQRIGVNGRLSKKGKEMFIFAYSIQLLDISSR